MTAPLRVLDLFSGINPRSRRPSPQRCAMNQAERRECVKVRGLVGVRSR